ncbi:MAG TPA: hypothetical protein VFH95_12705 [Candidatus Kapabacteria bacterium]|nr:hypothetical protein [Candidatus Kapabacteria bacterium]
MKKTSRLVYAIVSISFFSLAAHSQIRQTKLYIDDGSGHFTILQGAPGGDTLTMPTGSGTLQSSGGNLVVSTETDTAKVANTVTVSGNTACAIIVSNGSTASVAASVTAATPGQILYLFNNLATSQSVTFKGLAIGQGTFGIFIYLAGDWRVMAVPGVI